jgi:hypothetical protein
MMGTVSTSETTANFYRTTRLSISEDSKLYAFSCWKRSEYEPKNDRVKEQVKFLRCGTPWLAVVICCCSRHDPAVLVPGLRAGRPGFDFLLGSIILLATMHIPKQPHSVSSSGFKRQGSESNHSPPSCAEVKGTWSYTSIPPYVCMASCLV